MTRHSASPLAVWTGLIVVYLVWGSTYLGMKLAIDTMPPSLMGFFRFVPAGVLLSALIILRHRGHIRRPSLRETRDAGIVGLLLLLGGTGLVAWGQQTIPTGIAALLIALVPMWLAILGWVFFRDPVAPLAAVGIAVGLLGVAILAWPAGGVSDLEPAGLLALVIAPVFWALGTLYAAKRAVLPGPALLASGIQMTIAGLGFALVAAFTGGWSGFDIAAVSVTSWAGIAYLVLVGSLVGYTTYAWLITVAPLSRVSTYAYVNPVVAVILGSIFLAEPLTPRTVIAAVVIVAAVVLIVTARSHAGRRQAPARIETPVAEATATH